MPKKKFIMATVLVALCAILSAGAVYAAPPIVDSWAVGLDATDLPSAMVGGNPHEGVGVYHATVDAVNTGDVTWDDTGNYTLNEVMGATGTAVAIDRWAVGSVDINWDAALELWGVDSFPPDEDYPFGLTIPPASGIPPSGFPIVAPPWVSLWYIDNVTTTSLPTATTFECNWIMAKDDVLMRDDTATSDVFVVSFPDVAYDSWAFVQIEQCHQAHTAAENFIVQGFSDGNYHATWPVTRAEMAVYISRAAALPSGAATATFNDVPTTYWAFAEIEACVLAGVVQGYTADDPLTPGNEATYLPSRNVTRDQMAVYIQRAAIGATVEYTGVFDDIQTDADAGWWAKDSIMACYEAGIVQGYVNPEDPLGVVYLPSRVVSRDQMAVFVWRAFVRDLPTDLVLGGPAAVDFDEVVPAEGEAEVYLPGSLTYYGWTSADLVPGSVVYLALDAVALRDDGQVTFAVTHSEVNDNGTPDDVSDDFDEDVVEGEFSADLDASNAFGAVVTSGGNPYLVVAYTIPTDLTSDELPEDYTVTIGLPQGGTETLEFTVEE